jgi:hypothetical protein
MFCATSGPIKKLKLPVVKLGAALSPIKKF